MRTAVIAMLLAAACALGLTAQSKPIITRADYGQWETLTSSVAPRGGLSPDGQWLAYGVNRANRKNELRVQKLADGTSKSVPFGAQAAFSSDSKWIAYAIGHSEEEQDRAERATTPLQNALGTMNLTGGETSTIEGIESFAFSADGAYLAMKRYRPRPPGTAAGGARGAAPAPTGRGGRGASSSSEEETAGTTLIVRQLATGRDTTFGNVAEYAWEDADRTHLLAMAISADEKAGNGLHVFDAGTSQLQVLDSAAANYSGLSWRKDAADLAALETKTDEKRDGPTHIALAWTNVGSAAVKNVKYDPVANSSFPAGMRIVSFRRPSWTDDGRTILLGMAAWELKPPASSRRGGRGSSDAEPPAPSGGSGSGANALAADTTDDEPAAVDIWHSKDPVVMARQKLSAASDRRRNLLAAWRLDTGKLTQLGKDLVNEQVTPIRHTNLAYVSEWSAYAMSRSIGRPAADLYVADIGTGARTKLKENVNDRYVQMSPGGKYLLFLQDDHYWTIDLATHAVVNITKTVATSFIDKESDETVKQKPPFGTAGWIKDDAGVLLYDKYDIWRVAPDGSHAARLTSGAADQVRHRLVRVDPDAESIDLSKPAFVSLFGLLSKKSGYARLSDPPERVIWADKLVSGLAKAKDADTYVYSSQDYDDSPDLFVGGSDLRSAKQATTSNAFQNRYAWGRTELIEYKTDKGVPLQGTLYYPAGYQAGRKHPMIVYLYERLSDNVHRYVAPSEREYYNTTVFSSQGYFVLQPDIAFRPRQPGLSVVECVTAAIRKVLAGGLVDPAHVGVVGHSWGGFDTAFLATHTTGVFAAAVAGAPITDLVSNYGNHHWSSGIAETDHIETGQQRMEVPLYEDLQDYINNSAVFNAHNMTVPLLIEVGDSDGTVFWHQGVELYNIARRARKDVVMLVYNGEDHGLRQKKNQIDYQQRILAWFGHYLKGDPAAAWITSGETFLQREDEVKRANRGKSHD